MLENHIKMISNDKNDKILSLRFNSFNLYSCFFSLSFTISIWFLLKSSMRSKFENKNWFELFWGFQTTDTYLGFYGNLFWNFFEDFSPSAKYPVRLRFGNRKDIGQIGLIKLSVVQVKKNFLVWKNFFCVKKNFLSEKKFSCLIVSYWCLIKIFTIYLNKNYILPKTSETNAGSVQIRIGSSRPSTRTLITP